MARGSRMNGYIGEFYSSFLSCEKDSEKIIRKLFVESRPYSDYLKRLLLINTKDCLDDMTNPAYIELIRNTSIQDLHDKKYIRFSPKVEMDEHEEAKSYILITFDNFTPNRTNPYYRDCIVEIDIFCHTEYWDIGNFRQRPLKIAGYIDGILNNNKLSGIGTLEFLSCNEIVLNENLSGYCLMYSATHGNDDIIEGGEGDGN
jgi:hypothetical protein